MRSGVFHTDYASDMSFRPTWLMRSRIILIVALVLIFPLFADRYWLTLANTVGIAAIGAIGLNILVGFTGQISIGHGGFLAVGAYVSGLLAQKMGVPFWLSIPIACFATAGVGVIFGLPSVRLKGLYLAIATLAAQEIIIWAIRHLDLVGIHEESLTIPYASLFGTRLTELTGQNNDVVFYWIILLCLIGTIVFTANLFRSRVGRAFVAIRDQDIAAQVIGVDLFRYKLMAFSVSSFFAGLAGALTAHYRGIVSWERFTIDVSILYLSMIIVGGLGSISGAIYGAAFIVLLPAILTDVGRALNDVIPQIDSIMPFIKNGAYGLAIILFLIFEPEGINKMWRNVKDYFRLWPFNY